MKHKQYEIITPSGSRIVMIEDKSLGLKHYIKLFCQSLSQWFNEAEVDQIIGAFAVTFMLVGIYCAAALI